MQRYANELPAPKGQSLRPQGSYPVIARLVLPEGGEEWRPGTATRWTARAVLVGWLQDGRDPRSTIHAWLPVGDVARVIRR